MIATEPKPKAKYAGAKIDPYDTITEKVITLMETKGIAPWRKSWKGSAVDSAVSISTGKEYSGINSWLLSVTQMMEGYTGRYWGTFKSVKDNGGQIRKGEKGTMVVFWKWIEVAGKDGKKDSKIPFLRHFSVFHSDQADWPDGLPEKFKPVADGTAGLTEFESVESAEAIAAGYLESKNPPSFGNNGGDRAYYRPSTDHVAMPLRTAFASAHDYYSVLFHELGHSTGHKTRLARTSIGDANHNGLPSYSEEELVAEFTACFLCADSGITDTRENSAAYLANWAKVLKDDKKLIIRAAGRGAKAAAWIRGIKPTKY